MGVNQKKIDVDFDNSEKEIPIQSIEGWIIFVTGIHNSAKESEIYGLFAEFGEIQNLHLNLDRQNGFVKGYALVGYKDKNHAELARSDMNGKEILGKKLM